MSAGLASGVFSGVAAIPGPPAVAYYLGTGVNARQTRASLLIFCFVTVVATVPGLVLAGGIDRNVLIACAYAFPALAIGSYLGAQIFERLTQDQYRTVGLGVMAFSAVLAGWHGISAWI